MKKHRLVWGPNSYGKKHCLITFVQVFSLNQSLGEKLYLLVHEGSQIKLNEHPGMGL